MEDRSKIRSRILNNQPITDGVLRYRCQWPDCQKLIQYKRGRQRHPDIRQIDKWLDRLRCPFCGRWADGSISKKIEKIDRDMPRGDKKSVEIKTSKLSLANGHFHKNYLLYDKIMRDLFKTSHSISEIARILGVDRKTVYNHLTPRIRQELILWAKKCVGTLIR